MEFLPVGKGFGILGQGRNNHGDAEIEDDPPAGGVNGPWPASPGGDSKPICADGFR